MITGTIYKIECNETGEVYYGSTQQSLKKRMIYHKANCKAWKEGKHRFTTSFRIIERGNYSYSLIETVECEDRKELETRERFYIENNKSVNKFLPCRMNKGLKEYHEEYYKANKDKKKESKREKDKEYYQANQNRIKESQKAYRDANKDAINEKRRQQRADKKKSEKNN
jgi:hypothetical protein